MTYGKICVINRTYSRAGKNLFWEHSVESPTVLGGLTLCLDEADGRREVPESGYRSGLTSEKSTRISNADRFAPNQAQRVDISGRKQM